MWFMVCRWPQPQEGDWTRPHLCKLARHGNVNGLSETIYDVGDRKWVSDFVKQLGFEKSQG